MNPLVSKRLLLVPLLTALLAAGCSTAPSHNRRIYDRYAQLVAERSRAPATSVSGREAAETAAPAARTEAARPAKPAEPRKPAAARPAPSARPVAKPAPAKAPKPEPAPAPAPAPEPPPPAPAPVQIVAPPPAEAASPAPVETPDEAFSSDGVAYTLKQGDVVQITLRGIPNAEAIESIIDENGMVNLPFINEVLAAGRTSSELARHIRQTYLDEGIYRNISVGVVVPTRYYFVQGEIRAPGRYQIMSATRVSQAIAGAGGYTEFASGRVVIKRGGKIVKNIRNARRLERTPEDDILLEPDDIIEVQRSLW
ncbi:MAG: polysaccharide biosynthesis/export family protein [Kiritimatiellae bacterium]|nr:polysaccharide biosynthesis/export family protein [Kiritimatiellia bacterium]